MDKEHTIKLSEDDWETILALLGVQEKTPPIKEALEIQRIHISIREQIEEQICSSE